MLVGVLATVPRALLAWTCMFEGGCAMIKMCNVEKLLVHRLQPRGSMAWTDND